MKEPKQSQILRQLILDLNGAEFAASSFNGTHDFSSLITRLHRLGEIDRSTEPRLFNSDRKVWVYTANSNLKLKEVEVKAAKKEKVTKKTSKEIILELMNADKRGWQASEFHHLDYHPKSIRTALRELTLQEDIHISGKQNEGRRNFSNIYNLGKSPDGKYQLGKSKAKAEVIKRKLSFQSDSPWKDVYPELFTLPKFKELGVKVHSQPY
jgi:hypothetical protein